MIEIGGKVVVMPNCDGSLNKCIPNFSGCLDIYYAGHCIYCKKSFLAERKDITNYREDIPKVGTQVTGHIIRCPHCGSILDAELALSYPFRDQTFVCFGEDGINNMDKNNIINLGRDEWYEYDKEVDEWVYRCNHKPVTDECNAEN